MSANQTPCDSDYEEEEILVFADFKNNILNELEVGNPQIKIIGIDSENPIAEVNGNIFKGELFAKEPGYITDVSDKRAHHTVWGSRAFCKGRKYDFSMGTHVIFEEDDNPPPVDPIFEKYSKKTFKYLNKTNKVLNFSRIFVEAENPTSENSEANISTAIKKTERSPLTVDKTYEEALQELKYNLN